MNLLKNKFVIVVLFLVACIGNMYAQKSNTAWNGDWTGKNAAGDMMVSLTLNVDKKANLNPHDETALCNGFMTVYIVEPSGRSSVLSTVELLLKSKNGATMNFSYKGGREGVDNLDGECSAVISNGKLQFKLIRNNGDDALFNQVKFSKDAAEK